MTNSSGRHFALIAVTLTTAYAAVALPLSILAIYVTTVLGLSNFLGGLSVGASFLVTISTRKFTGAEVDRLGGRACFIRGAFFYSAGGFLCMAAALLSSLPVSARYGLLILGRMSLGFGEGLLNNGVVHWSVGVTGLGRSGRALATIGMCMYGTIAFGGLAGLAVYTRFGFAALMAVCGAAPLLAVLMAGRIPGSVPEPASAKKADGESFVDVMKRIWKIGMGVCLHAVGSAIIGAFLVKSFLIRDWAHAGWGMFCFGSGYVLLRIFAGHLPDRAGGVPVAAGSLVIEMIGLFVLWLAPGPGVALVGALLVGMGCSMTYPALGREVLVTTPPESHGTALGCYSAFQDLAMGTSGPIAGLLADHFGIESVFLFAGVAAVAGVIIVGSILKRKSIINN